MVKVTKFEILSVLLSCILLDTLFSVVPPSFVTLKAAIFSTIFCFGYTTVLQLKGANQLYYWGAPIIAIIAGLPSYLHMI